MMLASEIRKWMKDMPDDTDIGIDEGGLCLVAREPNSTGWEDVLEVGGIPSIEDEDLLDELEDDDHLIIDNETSEDVQVKEMVIAKYTTDGIDPQTEE